MSELTLDLLILCLLSRFCKPELRSFPIYSCWIRLIACLPSASTDELRLKAELLKSSSIDFLEVIVASNSDYFRVKLPKLAFLIAALSFFCDAIDTLRSLSTGFIEWLLSNFSLVFSQMLSLDYHTFPLWFPSRLIVIDWDSIFYWTLSS